MPRMESGTIRRLGVWRSLVARSVRVGEAPSSNLGTPIRRPGASDLLSPGRLYPRGVLRAVIFDVDFTIARPGPDLGPAGYRELGLRYGLDLDPARYDEARAAAFAD